MIAAIGIAGFVAMGLQLVAFGRLMHRVIETVAKQARLIPLEPRAAAPLAAPAANPA